MKNPTARLAVVLLLMLSANFLLFLGGMSGCDQSAMTRGAGGIGGSGGRSGSGGSDEGTQESNSSSPGIFTGATASTLVACNTSAAGFIPAFPGAEGFGACARGGRGGQVIHVTNLRASGPGSLQAALDVNAVRTIVFDVSGYINSDISINYPHVTIAGQTSPSGITVNNLYCDFTYNGSNCHDVIVRNIRSRPGSAGDDALRIDGGQNIIIDHSSFGNAGDETVQMSRAANVTIQNSIFAELLGDHSNYGGMLINYSAREVPQNYISIHHNTWNRLEGRMPEFSCEPNNGDDRHLTDNCSSTTLNIEVSYNLLWDAAYFVDLFSSADNASSFSTRLNLNYVGNYAYARSNYPYGLMSVNPRLVPFFSLYMNDNKLSRYPTRSDYQLIYNDNDYPISVPPFLTSLPSYARTSRHGFPAITPTSSSILRSYIYANAGAFPRDPMDQRLMNPVNTGIILETTRNTNPVGDAHYSCASGVTPFDTDQDGIPDNWESSHGLNPNVADNNGFLISSAGSVSGCSAGYTNLECYLHSLMTQRLAERCIYP